MPLGTNAMWGVVLPVEKVNLLQNTSGERGTAGWGTLVGGTVGTTANVQQFGAWSGSVAPTSNTVAGAHFGTWSAGAGTAYTASAYVRGANGVLYSLAVQNGTSDADNIAVTVFTGGGTWHRYSVSYSEIGDQPRRIAIRKNSDASVAGYYVDGVQVEVGSLTTYIDGDQEGCLWQGAPHTSSSLRSGQSRAGGSVIALADLGFRVDDAAGVGMAPLETSSQSYALLPGAEFQSQRAEVRPFVLSTQMGGTTWRDFHNTRRTVINALKIDAIAEPQPIRFWYVGGEGTVQIDAVLDAGMEGGNKSGFTESYGVRFLAHDPYWKATTDEGTALTSRVSLGSANFMLHRDPLGRWGTMAGTVNNFVRAFAQNAAGSIFIGGPFRNVAGTSAPCLAFWAPDSDRFGTLTGGTVGEAAADVAAMAFSPAGTLYFGGITITTVGGTATKGAGQWNGNFGTLAGGTVDDLILAMHYSASGTLYVGGQSNTAGGTQAPGLAMWRPSNNTWGTLHNGTVETSGTVFAITSDFTGRVLFGGSFTEVGGTTANHLGLWAGSFGTIGGGVTNLISGHTPVTSLCISTDNQLYVGGCFGSASGGSAQNIARSSGLQLSPLANGIGTRASEVRTIVNDRNGALFVGGVLWNNTTSTGSTPSSFAAFNGYSFLGASCDIADSRNVYAAIRGLDGTLYIGGDWTGTARAASVTQVVNTGMSNAYPVLRIRNTGSGTARLYQFANETTGDGIYFNLVLQAGEEAILSLQPGQRAFQSSAQGTIFGKILAGSNLAAWRLLPGTNYVSFFADSDNLTTSLYWRPRSWSADGTVR